MGNLVSRRKFLGTASAAAVIPRAWQIVEAFRSNNVLPDKEKASSNKGAGRIVDMHVHFDAKKPNYIDDFLKVSDHLNLTACLLTPFAHRKLVAEAAKQHPTQIIPFGFVDLDAPDVVKQVEELHAMGYRGLGEMEFVKKPYNDPSYFPVYELANRYGWIVLFHTGIVLRQNFDEPEDVASGRMRPIHLEEIARRFPKITVLGAHCGNPEYEWAAEVARWNPNVFFDLSGSTLTKMHGRLAEFQKIFWWSATEWRSAEWTVKTPNNDPSAFIKIVFGSDTDLSEIEAVVNQYRAMFDACDVPERTRKMIMGGTLSRMLGLPD
jgi:predicted TIM-barrel fold metal-dependent hydrolase